MAYCLNGREKLSALGASPELPLKHAREKRDAANDKLRDGIDPGEARKEADAKAASGDYVPADDRRIATRAGPRSARKRRWQRPLGAGDGRLRKPFCAASTPRSWSSVPLANTLKGKSLALDRQSLVEFVNNPLAEWRNGQICCGAG
ncbi:MAG: Arm DNA-binding domain-containing protein [Proteobacteria bacterium]|nr:Arm DNA-binding domain-containing protein [Pseudomonadota bacterium]